MSYPYRMVISARLWLYQHTILSSGKLSCPVISIGNITAGGTGKTPMTLFLARLVKEMGFRPLILSRGYQGKLSSKGGMVSDGHTLFMTARDAGDEPYMMARRLEFPVFIGQDRYKTGRMALKTLTPDVIILDDGFQHLGLQRDLDIVLMDFHKPRGSNRLLPAGNLREPLESGLKRADIIVFTRCPDTIDILYQQTIIPREITQTNIPCFYTRHVPGLYRYIGGTCPDENNLTQASQLSGLKVLAFSGIAVNRFFRQTLENMGMIVLAHLEFNDHYQYKETDFLYINGQAGQLNAQLIVTTEKDFARMDDPVCFTKNMAVIGIHMELIDHQDQFKTLIKGLLHP